MDKPERPEDLEFNSLMVFGLVVIVAIGLVGAAAAVLVVRLLTHLW